MSITSMPVVQAPDQLLQQALYGKVPEIKPYEALAELNSRVKKKQMGVAQQGNAAIQQAMQLRQQPTIAQQVSGQNDALDNGIAQLSMPTQQCYAGGGIVSFASGGETPYTETYVDEDGEYVLSRDGRTKYYKGKSFPYNTKVVSPYASDEERAAAIQKNKEATPFVRAGEIPKGNWYTANDGVRYEYPEAGAGRGFFLPPAAVKYPDPPKVKEPEKIVPDTLKEKAKARVSTGSRAGQGKSALTAPKYDLTAPEYDSPEARSAEEFAAQGSGMVSPRMKEYDARMQKYLERAQAMQRGEGVDKPSRFKRGLDSALAGATDEVAAARRAGVRPSLGMALAGAGKAASNMDKEYKNKLEAMKEKGFEREFALEQARMAQERGEMDRAQGWMKVAEQRASEIRNIANAGKDKQFEVDKGGFAAKQRNYELDRQSEEKAKDRAATIQAAGIRAANSSGALTPQRISEIRRKVEADLDKELKTDLNYMKLQIRDAQAAEAEKVRRYQDRLQRALAEESGIVPPTPGANPGAAPSRVIDFSTIK